MTTDNAIQTITSALDQGGEHVGDIFWWSCHNASIRCDDLARIWEGAGLDKGALCEPPTPLKAIRRASSDSAVGKEEWLVRTAAISGGFLILAIVRETRDGQGHVEYSQEAQLAVHMATGDWASDNAAHPLVAAIVSRYVELRQVYDANDLRRSILRVLRDSFAVSIRESGGVYWMPPHGASVVRALASVISQVGDSIPAILPVHATAEGKAALGTAAKGALEAELADLKDEIAKFEADGARKGTLERRLEAFDALRSRAQLYREVLSVEVDDLDGKLALLSERVAALLAEPAAPAEPAAEAELPFPLTNCEQPPVAA